ncbi:hypothetical protein Gpo141_00006077 [Globisporangium polare]
MATIYRRNRGLSPMQPDDARCPEDLDSAGARRWWGGWGQRRRSSALTALGDASPLSVRNPIINGVVGSDSAANSSGGGRRFMSHRVYQIMWLAVLVYAFLGLPVLGRVLNFLRYSHRFSGTSMLKGLVAGLFQDVAVFFQASTLICIVKLLLHESSLLSLSGGAGSSAANGRSLSERSNSWLRSDSGSSSFDGGYVHNPSRQMRHPVYMPVLSSEYDSSNGNDSDSSTVDSFGRHTTLLASSGVAGPTASYLSSIAPRGTWLYMKVCSALQNCLVAVLIKAVVVAATIASVVDFCLQVTMHPRLNRAFVEIFFNYASQFTASLLDEEVLTRTVVCSWAVYLALIGALTYGFYANKLPLLPSFFFLPGTFFSCYSCQGHFHQGKRKDSMMSSTAASSALPLPATSGVSVPTTRFRAFIASLFPSHWFAAKPPQPPITRARRRSGQNHSLYHHHANQQPSSLFAHLFGCSSSTPASSSAAFAVSSKPSPSMVVLRCFVTSVVMTLVALTASLMVNGKGVDMKLMSNAMFSLQTEGFFVRSTTIGREEINCTLASQELLATLDKNEIYETEGLGNDDRCALLWRKTVGYTGESFFEIELKNVTTIVVEPAAAADSNPAASSREAPALTPAAADAAAAKNEATTAEDATTEAPTTATAASTSTSTPKTVTKVALPNIIVISMESWRALDVGVLGGAERKAKFGKSATPEFDELTKTGVLYRKHYTQCVQTTRTLLTQLFGMLPSCTETTALKRYGTSLNVRGLPQYLKRRGYFNMFWSAVNLSWEYWDKFLVQNGFDKLVDDRKIRKMLHEVRDYKNRDDDHFSWGMHDHLSFEMLLHAIESSHNATRQHALDKEKNSSATAAAVSTSELEATTGLPAATGASVAPEAANSTETKTARPSLLRNRSKKNKKQTEDAEDKKKKKRTESLSAIKSLPGWEGLQEPYFIDMYTISSHNPWALPDDYKVPDLSSLYTPYTKKYIDSMYFSDEMLGKFIREMRAKGLMKNTVVLIQGDHGYGRMEHNNPSIADSGIYDEGSHVPFLILADDFLSEQEKGMQVDQLTMQSDLMATVADIVGVSPDEPLYQHGYGHSMKRRRPVPVAAEEALDLVLQPELAEEPTEEQLASLSSPTVLQERRVVMCNPFNGMTKGIRTEKRKFAFFPDGAFKVFEPASDPVEKSPVRAGFDVEKMDFETKTMFEFAAEHVDLNQFLFENNKFMAPAPAKSHGLPPSRHHQQPHIKRVPIQVEQEQYLAETTSSFASAEALEHSSGDAEPHLAPAVSNGDKISETPAAPSPSSSE